MRLILIFIFCCSNFLAYCQKSDFRFNHINSKNGLSHNSVISILQDSKGFMWFGTYGGLNRYDGYKFINYRPEQGNKNSLQSNSITTVYEDRNGIIWVGTYGGGLNKYDPNTEQFTVYKYLHLSPESNIVPKVSFIYEDRSGILWIGTSEGLDRFDPINNQFINYKLVSDIHAENNLTSVCEGSSSSFWIGSYLGLKLFDRKSEQFTCFKHDSSDANSLSHCFVYSILEDSSGIVWIGTGGGGLDRYDPKTKIFTHFKKDTKKSNSISSDVVYVVESFGQDKLIIGTEFGINIFEKASGNFEHVLNNSKDPYSLSNNNVRSIYKDKCGITWVGTDGGGINKMNKYSKKFNLYQFNVYDTQSLSNNNVFTVHHGSSELIWIGTIEGGLNSFDLHTRKFCHFVHNPKDPYSLSSNKILSLATGPSGNLWIGTDRAGLCMLSKEYINAGTGEPRFIIYKPDPNDPNSLNSDIIYSLCEDRSGTVWAGTWGRGLNRLTFNKTSGNGAIDYSRPEITHFRTNPKDSNSISSDIVFKIYEDTQGTIWIGTTGGGLNKLVVSKNKIEGRIEENIRFVSYKFDPNDTTSISDNDVSAIFESGKGEFWVGTSLGLNKMDRNTGAFKIYTTKNGLPNNVVFGIQEDKSGNLWIGTQGGIGKFDPVNEIFRTYTREDGLVDNVFNPDAFCTTKAGEMFFGGPYGITSFFPDSIYDNPFAPQVMITDFRILNKSVTIGEKHGSHKTLKRSISRTSEIFLSYKDNVLTFEFSASNYANSLKNLYAFKMEGFDNDWVFTKANNRDATYTNLDPGVYTFRVKASNCDGVWNNDGTSVKVFISPPYWKTWWFRSLVIIFILFILYSVFRLKVRDIKYQRLLLEKVVKERTEELNNSNALLEERNEEILSQKEEVEAQKNHILEQKKELEEHRWNLEDLVAERTAELESAKNKAEETDRLKTAFLTNMSHEIRTPLNAIVGFSTLFIDTELTEEEKVEYHKQISQNTESLLLLIDDILDLSKIESGQLEIINEKFSVNRLMDSIYSYWLLNKTKKEIDLKLCNREKENDIWMYSDKYRIKQIVTNFMSNAIKFTDSGYIELGFEMKGDKYLIYVKDTGIGIAEENHELIFDRFRKLEDDKTKLYRGVGLGLAISKSIANMLGGKISVESKPAVGSTFYFSLPSLIKEDTEVKSDTSTTEIENQYSWGDKNILIVEDNDASYLYLKKVIEKTNAKIAWAVNGINAVEYFRSGKAFDIVLMDIKLPGISGIQALKLIRDINPKQKIIAQTAYASIKNEKEIMEAGFDDYLPKPTNALLLLHKMNILLNKQ